MLDDAQLLRQYVETRSEAAFAELVQRHIGLVYHSAARQLGAHRHLAEDVAQGVFVLLAEKSLELLGHATLAGWLYATTTFKVSRVLRSEHRRRVREEAAVAMNERDHRSDAPWDEIRPVLDGVLQELNARDREAVLLRYFEAQPYPEIAARLQLSEAATYKTVERALEKLRSRLARRGVTSTTAALGALLGSHAALAAPAGLSASVMSAVVASGLPIATAAGGIIMSTKMTVSLAAVVVAIGVGVTGYEVQRQHASAERLAAAESEVRALEAQLKTEQARIAHERASVQAAAARTATSPTSNAAAPTAPVSAAEQRALAGRAFLKAHPEVEAAFRKNLRARTLETYEELIAEMGLTDEEKERFITLMNDATTRAMGQYALRLRDEPFKPGEYGAALKALLGPTRFAQLNAFNDHRAIQSLSSELIRSLYYTPTPLDGAQLEQFKQMVKQCLDDRTVGPKVVSMPPHFPPGLWDEILKRSATVLTSEQIEALGEFKHQSAFWRARSEAATAYRKKQTSQ